jgi:hypothetical protein
MSFCCSASYCSSNSLTVGSGASLGANGQEALGLLVVITISLQKDF